jgi:hypothetical protein
MTRIPWPLKTPPFEASTAVADTSNAGAATPAPFSEAALRGALLTVASDQTLQVERSLAAGTVAADVVDVVRAAGYQDIQSGVESIVAMAMKAYSTGCFDDILVALQSIAPSVLHSGCVQFFSAYHASERLSSVIEAIVTARLIPDQSAWARLTEPSPVNADELERLRKAGSERGMATEAASAATIISGFLVSRVKQIDAAWADQGMPPVDRTNSPVPASAYHLGYSAALGLDTKSLPSTRQLLSVGDDVLLASKFLTGQDS